jgi:uncharacterized protein (DUF1684 family)
MTIPLAFLAVITSPATPATSAYEVAELTWRANREAGLKRPRGWLAVSALSWLKEGKNTFGSDPTSDVVLPSRAAGRVGVLNRIGDAVSLIPGENVAGIRVGKATISAETILNTDQNGSADRVSVGDLTFSVIKRGSRLGVRLWDPQATARRNFTGLNWFPVDPKLRVEATFVPYDPPRRITILNIIGDRESNVSPGYVTFSLGGKFHRLEAQDGGNGELFLNFIDKTTGKTTYPAGRFLDTPAPKDGKVVIDFNRAYNPPCAFTAYATCPLPPAANRLSVAITAGEKKYRDHH